MNYVEYVALAYGVFALVLLWDFIVPRLQFRQYLRQVRKQMQRSQRVAAASTSLNPATLSEKLAK